MAPDGIGQGFQQGGGFAHPVSQRRAVQIQPFAIEYLALAVKWQMVGVFVDQHMGQQARTRTPTLDRA